MKITQAPLPGLLLLEPPLFEDERGAFLELWNAQRYAELGIDVAFRQDNLSRSRKNVLRGLHAQVANAQAKLVSCLVGAVWDVAVDAREGSPTFGRWTGYVLSQENRRQAYLPVGFLHGFLALSDEACVYYKTSTEYRPEGEVCVRWNDPDLAIDWTVASPILSPRDAAAPSFAELHRRGALAFTL